MPSLQGEIQLSFARNEQHFHGVRTVVAETEIDTVGQTLSFDIKNETEYYSNLEQLVINGKSIQEVAQILHDYLVLKNRCTDIVVLTRAGTESPWLVRCGPPDKVLLECLKIDPETGNVTEI